MSKFRVVLCDSGEYELKRYYRPVLISIPTLRSFHPELPTSTEEIQTYIRSNPNKLIAFLLWYHGDSSETVTDPKGKSTKWFDSPGLADFSVYEEDSKKWRWLFRHFPVVDEIAIREFCNEYNYDYDCDCDYNSYNLGCP